MRRALDNGLAVDRPSRLIARSRSACGEPHLVASFSVMAHEIPKLILEHAKSLAERTEAIKTALQLGMKLAEIEEYLDWLDQMPGGPHEEDSPHR